MKSDSDSTPLDINKLTSLIKSLRKQVTHQSLFIDQLLEQIKLVRHHRFGVKSEHISPDQFRLLLENEQNKLNQKKMCQMILQNQRQHLSATNEVGENYPIIYPVWR